MCDQLACKSALEQLSVDGVPPDNCFDAFRAGFGSLFGRFLGMYNRFAPDLRDQLGANRRLNNCQLIGCRLAIVSAVLGNFSGTFLDVSFGQCRCCPVGRKSSDAANHCVLGFGSAG